nr:hypothetical protein [Tanacetum cinerariifolium]
ISASLDGQIFSRGKKCQESNIVDSDNTGDGGKIVSGAIGACGGIGMVVAAKVKQQRGDGACFVAKRRIRGACKVLVAVVGMVAAAKVKQQRGDGACFVAKRRIRGACKVLVAVVGWS